MPAWAAWSPWLKFSQATFMPSSRGPQHLDGPAFVCVWAACARSRGLPHTRERGCVRAHRWLDSTLAMHHEAGPSVQMMRVRFCLEAAEKPSYPAAYGILAMRMSTFLLLLSYVVWPRHMMVRRATSARGGVLFRFYV